MFLVYRGADCMEIILFCESLREHIMKIINFEKQWYHQMHSRNRANRQKSAICKKKVWT